MDDLLNILFYLFAVMASVILHEYAHGAIAERLGDPTARLAGRLTINPIAHIDLWGTILMPLLLFVGTGGQFLFGYAKPVPYNPYNLRNQRWGPVAVALAGPLVNFLLAISFGIALRFFPADAVIYGLLSSIVYVNIVLGVFNLVPIPPLDGSKVLYAVMPSSWFRVKQALDQYGTMILLIFVLFFFSWLIPIIQFLFSWISGSSF